MNVSRCRKCGRRKGLPLEDSVHRLAMVEEAARQTTHRGELEEHRRRAEELLDVARRELLAIEGRMAQLLGEATAVSGPGAPDWEPPSVHRDPPPPEFRALAAGQLPAPTGDSDRETGTHASAQRPSSAHWRAAPPAELVELRRMLDVALTPSSSPASPFERPRAAGHNPWCACYECLNPGSESLH